MLCLRIGPRNRISAVKASIWKIWPIILSTIDALIFTFDAWCVYIWIFERCCVLRHRRQTKDILVLLIQLAWQPVYPLDDNSQIYDGHLFIPTCIVLHLGLAVECLHTTLDASSFFYYARCDNYGSWRGTSWLSAIPAGDSVLHRSFAHHKSPAFLKRWNNNLIRDLANCKIKQDRCIKWSCSFNLWST